MPIYEFECKNCGSVCELMMKISDPHPESCPSCGKDQLQKIMSRTSFVLKGQGWYETDFKQNPAKPKEDKPSSDKKDDTETTTKDRPSEVSKSDTKPSEAGSSAPKSTASESKPTPSDAKE